MFNDFFSNCFKTKCFEGIVLSFDGGNTDLILNSRSFIILKYLFLTIGLILFSLYLRGNCTVIKYTIHPASVFPAAAPGRPAAAAPFFRKKRQPVSFRLPSLIRRGLHRSGPFIHTFIAAARYFTVSFTELLNTLPALLVTLQRY